MFNDLLHHHSVYKTVVSAVKVIMVIVPLALLADLINQSIFITPTLSYMYRPGRATRAVSPTAPTTLIRTADAKLRWRVTTDNFPFKVIIPRLIEAVRVRVRLQPGTQSYIALNAKAKTDGDYSTIVSSAALDNLDWKHVSDGTMTLWMRDKRVSEEKIVTGTGKKAKTKTVTTERTLKQYASINDFRSAPPDLNTVATAGYDRLALASIPNYQPRSSPITLNRTFRGNHQLYVYAANEDLRLAFDKIDLNRQAGADTMTVQVARADQLTNDSRTWLKTITVADDGNAGPKGPRGAAQRVDLAIKNVPAGTYLVDITATEDVVFNNLTSAQHNLAFNGRVFLAEGPAYGEPSFQPVQLVTSGSSLSFAANHDQGKQTLTVAGKKFNLKELKVNQTASGLSGPTAFEIAKGDATVLSDGLIAIAPAELIPDGVHPVDVAGAPDLTPYDYIIAKYQPRPAGDKKDIVVDRTYNLNDLGLATKTLTFSIASPGLKASDAQLGLRDIRVTLIRGPFPWNKIWQKLGLK